MCGYYKELPICTKGSCFLGHQMNY